MAQDVKSVCEVLIANVKTVAGVAIADVKTIAGVDNTSGGGGGIALVNHVEFSVVSGGSNTSSAIDTTGADLIVIFVGSYVDWVPSSMTDSKGNTYIALTLRSSGGQTARLYYCESPTVGSGHTFTLTGAVNFYHFMGALAFSGANAASYHSENGFAGSPTGDTAQPGAVVPAVDGSVIVTGIFNYSVGSSPSINGGYTVFGVGKSGNQGMGGIAYLIQGTAASTNPNWTSVGINGGAIAVAIADFAPA